MDDWRDIPCASLDWHSLPGINRRVAWLIERQCSEASDWIQQHDQADAESRWHTMTLGELADRGEKWWRRNASGFGKVCAEAVKTMIDRAAAGYEVRKNSGSANAYTPREIQPPPPHLARNRPPADPSA